MSENVILRIVSKFLIPLILLFGLYVQAHGDYSPGGGFQAGVIFASGMILYGLIFGIRSLQRLMSERLLHVLIASGLLLFAIVGIVPMMLGHNFLDFDVLALEPLAGQHLGILLVEFGVGITVAAVMITIFIAFAGRRSGR